MPGIIIEMENPDKSIVPIGWRFWYAYLTANFWW
jgi:hypothetical protein